jgi:hypothetical protein
MNSRADISETGGVQTASASIPVRTAARSRWLPVVGGLFAGTVAAGTAGTSTQTIYLGAVWAGTATGIAIVGFTAYLAVRHLRGHMPPSVLRRQFTHATRNTLSWALGSYVFWFLLIEPALSHAGIYVPMLR